MSEDVISSAAACVTSTVRKEERKKKKNGDLQFVWSKATPACSLASFTTCVGLLFAKLHTHKHINNSSKNNNNKKKATPERREHYSNSTKSRMSTEPARLCNQLKRRQWVLFSSKKKRWRRHTSLHLCVCAYASVSMKRERESFSFMLAHAFLCTYVGLPDWEPQLH